MIHIPTLEIEKKARSSTLYGVSANNAVTTDLKEAAIKALVSMDCLSVMVDTIPSYYPAKDRE